MTTATKTAPADPFSVLTEQFNKNSKRYWNLTRHILGIDRAEVGVTPRDEVWANGKSVLYRYKSDKRSVKPPVLLVMSLVSRSFILDLQPGNSFIEHLLDEGLDVFLLDWGVPDESDAANRFETYVDELIPEAVATVNEAGGDVGVTVFGYCLGGVLALLYAAGHPNDPINSLVVMATPVDFEEMPPAMRGVGRLAVNPDHLVDETGNVPAASVRSSFIMLTPTSDLSTVADFWERLDDDKFLNSYQAMTQWTRSHIPFPGATFKQMVEIFQEGNGFMNDEVTLGGRSIHLRDITVPFLNVIAEKDHIVPAASARPAVSLVGSKDATEVVLPAGHAGLIVGSRGRTQCMPAMSSWMIEHSTVEHSTVEHTTVEHSTVEHSTVAKKAAPKKAAPKKAAPKKAAPKKAAPRRLRPRRLRPRRPG